MNTITPIATDTQNVGENAPNSTNQIALSNQMPVPNKSKVNINWEIFQFSPSWFQSFCERFPSVKRILQPYRLVSRLVVPFENLSQNNLDMIRNVSDKIQIKSYTNGWVIELCERSEKIVPSILNMENKVKPINGVRFGNGAIYSLEDQIKEIAPAAWEILTNQAYHNFPVITKAPGFAKKRLAEYKLDLMAQCQFSCTYCSSNCGNNLRIRKSQINDMALHQHGVDFYPDSNADAMAIFYHDPVGRLNQFLDNNPSYAKINATLQFGMLVDNFSPNLSKGKNNNTTLMALKTLLERTQFRIRILTKSSVVARGDFIELFSQYPGRVTVGISCGAMDDKLMPTIENGTSFPSKRAEAICKLQEHGIETFGMFCPVLPGYETEDAIKELLMKFNINKLSEIWFEPLNVRSNLKYMLDRLVDPSYAAHFKQVMTNDTLWQDYAMSLEQNTFRVMTQHFNFPVDKCYYLLYQDRLVSDQLARIAAKEWVLLQSKE